MSLSTLVDLIALLVLMFYALSGVSVGLWPQLRRLVSFVGGLYVALFFYGSLGDLIAAHFSQLVAPLNYAVAFVLLMFVVQWILGFLLHLAMKDFPLIFEENAITRGLAIIPALIDGFILVALFIVVLSVLPLPAKYTSAIASSHVGSFVEKEMPVVDGFLNALTAGHLNAAVTSFTSHAESSEQATTLPFKPSSTSVNTAGEAQMLADVNQARAAAGGAPVTLDSTLTQVARAHSQDMWDNQYFSHTDPSGKSPADRMTAAGITYTTAGENIALAPTVSLANTDLMNSPEHKANILNPAFHKIGIGIISGGFYGQMVTEDFTN